VTATSSGYPRPVDDLPRLYRDLASWWPLLSAPEDYADESAEYRSILDGASTAPVRAVLELGSGGGNSASHLKRWYEMTLVDRSPAMLEVSRRLNPDCEHLEGDMRSVRLGRSFDAVFVHDAVAYLTTEGDLRAAFATAFEHCAPGAPTLFVPDSVAETFEETWHVGGHDGPDRALRYLEWTWDPDPSDTTVRMDLTYVFHEPDGGVHAELDEHRCGLFPIRTWLDGLRDAGFTRVTSVDLHGDEARIGTLAFLGVRPG
jgi:SAM-dependent methyltransferase